MQTIVEDQPIWNALLSLAKDYVLDKAHYVWWALLVRLSIHVASLSIITHLP